MLTIFQLLPKPVLKELMSHKWKLVTVSFIALLVTNCAFSQHGSLYPVTLSEKINNSTAIVVGEVVGQQSDWNSSQTIIQTTSYIKVNVSYKGNVSDTIKVITVGGVVGNDMLLTSSLLDLKDNSIGMFFCNPIPSSNNYEVYASKQGYISYFEGEAKCPFYNTTISNLEALVFQITGTKSQKTNPKPATVPMGAPKILSSNISFSPSTITAGTNSILSITGSGFGTNGPNGTDFVAFSNADNGGSPSFVSPTAFSYVSWSDTLIKIFVPSPAGTGPIRVYSGTSNVTSSDTLFIPYAFQNNSTGVIPFMRNLNGSGGLTWTLHTNMSNLTNAFSSALDTWKCNTGVNWDISVSSTTTVTPDPSDGINIISRTTLAAGVLGVCYSYFTDCNNGLNSRIVAQDILFEEFTGWNIGPGLPASWQNDMESIALHELGHALLLGHVVDSDDALHFSVATGDVQRDLNFYNIVAGNLSVETSSATNNCSAFPMIQQFPAGCSSPILTDVLVTASSSSSLSNNTCVGVNDIVLGLTNLGVDTVTNIEFNWSVNGTPQSPFSWSGNILPDSSSVDQIIGSYDFQNVQSYDVVIWAETVNGSSEINQANDTLHYIFTPVQCFSLDAQLYSIENMDTTACLSSEPIIVDLVNLGFDDLTSCWLYFSANGVVQDSTLWTGLLSQGDTVENIVIGTYSNFYPSSIITAWLESPNGSSDMFTGNDSLTMTVTPSKLIGNYTIGGAQPDYANIEDALDDLNTYGICGDVNFNIRSGSYNSEVFAFDSIPDFGSHIVTVQSEAQHRDSVHFHYPLNYPGSPSLITIDSTRNLTIQHLSFHFDDANFYESMIEIENGAKNIHFEDNLFDLSDPNYQDNLTAKNTVVISAYSSTRRCDALSFKGNTFSYGRTGITYNGGFPSSAYPFPENLTIEDNFFEVQDYRSLSILGAKNLTVQNNTFTSESNFQEQAFLSDIKDSLVVAGNHFQNTGDKGMLNVEDAITPVSIPIQIYNNSFSHYSGSLSSAGVSIGSSGTVEFMHNTIMQSASGGYQSALSVVSDSVVLLNNQIIKESFGLVLSFGPQTAVYSDYNNFWRTGGSYFSIVTGINSPNFSSHQLNTGLDANSHNLDPSFFGAFYQVPTNFLLDDLGTPISSINSDIIGTSRNPVTPDIGAFEFNQNSEDIGILTSNLANSMVCSGAGSDLYFDVKNYGSQDIDSFYIYINIDNQVYDSVFFAEYIPSGGQSTVLVGNYTFNQDVSSSIYAETAFPNGVGDLATYNDGFSTDIFFILNGDYTVGNDTCNFVFIADAIDHLNNYGICGPVTFNIADGNYSNSLMSTQTIGSISGASSINTVTIQSNSLDSSLVTLGPGGDIFILNSTAYIRFNQLTFDPSGGYHDALSINSSSEIEVSNCHFTYTEIVNNGIQPGYEFSNLRILNSFFDGSEIDLEVNTSLSNGPLLIDGNRFIGQSSIRLENIVNPIISGNEFDMTLLTTAIVWLKQCSNFTFDKNNFVASRNSVFIQNCNNTGSGKNLISNNFFRADERALNSTSTDSLYILNNTFYNYIGTSTSNAHGLFFNSLIKSEFLNNILVSEESEPLIALSSTSLSNFNPDYNIYYHPTPTGNIIKEGTSNYYTFANWTTNQNKDLNSYLSSPAFVSSTDLHLDNAFVASGTALPISYLTDDIDSEPRDILNPDIGADEFNIDSNYFHDIGIANIFKPDTNVCTASDSIILEIANYSTFPIDSFIIKSSLFGNVLDSTWYVQMIPSGDTISVVIREFEFVENTLYQLDFIALLPNGNQDNYFDNNTDNTDYIYYDNLEIVNNEISDCLTDRELIVPNFSHSSILWSTSEQTPNITVSPPGTWSVDITDAQGCVVSGTITIN